MELEWVESSSPALAASGDGGSKSPSGGLSPGGGVFVLSLPLPPWEVVPCSTLELRQATISLFATGFHALNRDPGGRWQIG